MDTSMRHGAVVRTQNDDWGECLLPLIPRREIPKALKDEFRTIVGIVPPPTYWLAVTPWVARAGSLIARRSPKSISRRASEFSILVVAQDNSCRFCFSAQRASLKVQGYSESEIDALQRDFHTADLSDRDLAGLEFIRKIARGIPRPTVADFEALRAAGFDAAATADLCFLAACDSFMNRLMTLLALPPELATIPFVNTPLVKLAGPFIFRMVLSNRRRFAYQAPADGGSGPVAHVIRHFRGTYAAYVIDRVATEAMVSNVLPLRTKLLMMAVVAKASGCPFGIGNAVQSLAAEGFSRAEVEEILDHLTSPRLDPLELRLMSLARETVRYQPRALQRHMAEATEGLAPAEICEVAGILSLANALCRLTVLLECSPTW